jgi:hypothetical protein
MVLPYLATDRCHSLENLNPTVVVQNKPCTKLLPYGRLGTAPPTGVEALARLHSTIPRLRPLVERLEVERSDSAGTEARLGEIMLNWLFFILRASRLRQTVTVCKVPSRHRRRRQQRNSAQLAADHAAVDACKLGLAGSGATSVTLNTGENFAEIYNRNKDADGNGLQAPITALAAGIASGALDTFAAPLRVARQLTPYQIFHMEAPTPGPNT